MYYEDGLSWFNNRFSDDCRIDTPEFQEDPFDVLIIDALDPQDDVPFADILYANEAFFKTLYNALSDDGIIVLQLGEAPDVNSPPDRLSINRKREFVLQTLSKLFTSVHLYGDGNGGFGGKFEKRNSCCNCTYYQFRPLRLFCHFPSPSNLLICLLNTRCLDLCCRHERSSKQVIVVP